MAESSDIGLAGIYYQTNQTCSEILKQKAGNKLMCHILYLALHFQIAAIQDF